jgi:RNA polymerase sigma-70 factor (ECF subfamily)
VTSAERQAVLEKFKTATTTGDIQSLMDVLAPDVVLLTDGGGFKQAALRPIHGRDKVVRFLAGGAAKGGGVERADIVVLNGVPALQLWIDGQVDTVLTLLMDGGVATALYVVRNPEKLRALDHEVALER